MALFSRSLREWILRFGLLQQMNKWLGFIALCLLPQEIRLELDRRACAMDFSPKSFPISVSPVPLRKHLGNGRGEQTECQKTISR